MKTVLVTGAAGFIGAWTARALVERGDRVIGLDNFNSYYDPRLKRDRVKALIPGVPIRTVDMANGAALRRALRRDRVDKICHLGAQAGVRYSITHPLVYEKSNALGTLNMLEWARERGVGTFVFASSSSVYGDNKKVPFSVDDRVDHPVSLYAATKRANELTAHVYHHLYGIHCTGLRFFTVYGPWGRPDMAYYSFTKAVLEGKPIDVFNHGRMKRDFTYISDIVSGVLAALDRNDSWGIYNLGNNQPVTLDRFIRAIEAATGIKARRRLRPHQPGDVVATWADIESSTRRLDYRPTVDIETGVRRFVDWYLDYCS
ncbi:MAG: NAD-dependent epimerase/dehydratase family protein [Elusimicrobia bacterium]|nr:NAD-dependent epimerase/dehydratase family protein [Elusimicrobiota bacterium]